MFGAIFFEIMSGVAAVVAIIFCSIGLSDNIQTINGETKLRFSFKLLERVTIHVFDISMDDFMTHTKKKQGSHLLSFCISYALECIVQKHSP